jgi:dihydrodipicolinate reductase
MLDKEEFDPKVDLASLFTRYTVRILVHLGRQDRIRDDFRIAVDFQKLPYETRACIDAAISHAIRQQPLVWTTGIVDADTLGKCAVLVYTIRPVTIANASLRKNLLTQLLRSIEWFQLTPLASIQSIQQ